MPFVYIVLAAVMSLMLVASGLLKIRHDARTTKIIHDVVGVPLKYFPLLAACEFAGAAGLGVGIFWAPLGLASAVGLAIYFVGAVIGHLRVGDFKGLGPASFMLFLAAACFVLRLRGI